MNDKILDVLISSVIISIVFIIIIMLVKRDGKIKGKYDERQELVRGRGYKYAFYTLMFYNALLEFIAAIIEKRFMQGTIQVIIGMCIGIVVYASYCIWNDSYFAINDNPKRVLIIFILIGAINFSLGIINLVEGDWVNDGQLTSGFANFAAGILAMVVSIVAAAKWISNRKKEE